MIVVIKSGELFVTEIRDVDELGEILYKFCESMGLSNSSVIEGKNILMTIDSLGNVAYNKLLSDDTIYTLLDERQEEAAKFYMTHARSRPIRIDIF